MVYNETPTTKVIAMLKTTKKVADNVLFVFVAYLAFKGLYYMVYDLTNFVLDKLETRKK